jgi:hypothetical protein
MNISPKVIAVALMATAAPWFAAPAGAVPVAPLAGLQDAAAAPVESVQYRRGGGWHGGGGWHRGRGVGVGAGFVAGALIGGAIAGSQAYGPGPYYYGGYAPGYVEDDYDDGYVAVAPSGGSAVAYCAQRFRSYDPASGTYLGYDGLRHPCP